ncbi:MAG: hypothetical protein ACI30M_02775 [Muribaculaceae bacterium]
MKKSLLLASALLVASSAFAVVRDGAKLENVTVGANTYSITNRWIVDLNHDMAAYQALPLNNTSYRTACIAGDYILVAGWPKENYTTAEGEEKNDGVAHLLKFNLSDGKLVSDVKLTLDGALHIGTGAANQIGCDNFGNVWIADMCFDTGKSAINLYLVDVETGALTALPPVDPLNVGGETASTAAVRMDYCNIIGDVTATEAPARFMCAFNTDCLALCRAVREQGSDAWAGDFDGYFYLDPTSIEETYPMTANEETGEVKPQTSWGTAPMVCMINEGEFLGENFYVDGFTTAPVIYNISGAIIDGFSNKTDLAPALGTNGISEFCIGSDNFLVYSTQQYDKEPGCQARIACFGESFEYSNLTSCWEIPQGGLGMTSDGGTRAHCLVTKEYTDANGNIGIYVLTYKCYNGMAVYVVAQEGFQDEPLPDYPEEGGVEGIAADNNVAPVYFNLQGVRVDNPQNGLYIVKRGNEVAKQIIR